MTIRRGAASESRCGPQSGARRPQILSALVVLLGLVGCGGNSSSAATAPMRIVFGESGNLYSIQADGTGLVALADTPETEFITPAPTPGSSS